ncbi:VanZ family protein [Salinibacillus xinjiangensis]|uniref:VanZ family protein n=1 Tax=Salinibacillus xinjiangensis TaxID=1229268 RepID=UPI001E4C4B9D|nr:VanZ family protein [Salinibacillus xinjiangensis]
MVGIGIGELLILFGLPWFIYRGIAYIVTKKFSLKIEGIKGLFFLSIVFIYGMTIFPFPFYTYHHDFSEGYRSMNLVPFKSIIGSLNHFYYMVPLRNIVGNILLFAPLGLALPLRFEIHKLWKIVLIGFFTSLIVELIQLMSAIRAFDLMI